MRGVLVIFLASMLTFAQATPLTNQMIINMVRSGIPSDVIVKTIAAADRESFSFLPGDLQQLTQYNVPEDVFKAMAAKHQGLAIPGQPVPGMPQTRPMPAAPPATPQTQSMPAAAPAKQQTQPIAPAPLPAEASVPRQSPSGGPEPKHSEFQRAEVFGGYSYLNADFNNLFRVPRQSMNGWEASLSINANKWFAAEGDFSGWYKNGIDGVDRLNAHDYAFLGGPRVNIRPVFFHALFGTDRLGGSFLGSGLGTQNSFAAAFGGGLELKIARNWAARASADYALTRHNLLQLPGSFTQNHFRFGGGLVYFFGH